jgi:hypothetical protein
MTMKYGCLLAVCGMVFLAQPSHSQQPAVDEASRLFWSSEDPEEDEVGLGVPPGPPVEAAKNPVPEEFRRTYEWPKKDGTKVQFSYQAFRWAKSSRPEITTSHIVLVVKMKGVDSQVAAESLGLTPAAEERLRLFLWRDYEQKRANAIKHRASQDEAGQWRDRILEWSKQPLPAGPVLDRGLPGKYEFDQVPDPAKPFPASYLTEKRGNITLVDWGFAKSRSAQTMPIRIRWPDGTEQTLTAGTLWVTRKAGGREDTMGIYLILMRDFYQRTQLGTLTGAEEKLAAMTQILADWWERTELERKYLRADLDRKLESWNSQSFHQGTNMPYGLEAPTGYRLIQKDWDRTKLKTLPDPDQFKTTHLTARAAAPFLLWWNEVGAVELDPPGTAKSPERLAEWVVETLDRTQKQSGGNDSFWKTLPDALTEFSKRQWKEKFMIRCLHDWSLTPVTMARYAKGAHGCLIVVELKDGPVLKGRYAVPLLEVGEDGTATLIHKEHVITGKWKEWPKPAPKPGAPANSTVLPPLEFEISNLNALPVDAPLRKYRLFAGRGSMLGIFSFSVFEKDPDFKPAPPAKR